jgi:glutamate transport system permease protein
VAETVRAGVNSVSVGQAEAARSLGMPFRQVLGVVILPQALRTVVQPLGSIFIALIKNSALVTIISLPNLTKTGEAIGTATVQFFPALLGAGVAYLLLTLPSGAAVGWIERKVAFRR